MTIEERAKIASEYKATGKYNCTRAVIAAFEDVIKIDPEEITMLTAGFAAGMATMEGTCGAVIGAVIVAGALTEGKGTLKASKIILEKFKELSGSLVCKTLKGLDDKEIMTPCPKCVENAILALGYAVDVKKTPYAELFN